MIGVAIAFDKIWESCKILNQYFVSLASLYAMDILSESHALNELQWVPLHLSQLTFHF